MAFDELAAHRRATMGQYCYRQQDKNGPVVDMIGIVRLAEGDTVVGVARVAQEE